MVEAAVPGEAENADLKAVQKAKAFPKVSLRGSPASGRGTVKTRRLHHRRKVAQHKRQMRRIPSSIMQSYVSNYLMTDRPASTLRRPLPEPATNSR